MNCLLMTLILTGALLLGPVVNTCSDPWGEDPPRGGKGGAPVVESSDPWGEDHPWENRGKPDDVFESSYGGGEGSVKGKPAE